MPPSSPCSSCARPSSSPRAGGSCSAERSGRRPSPARPPGSRPAPSIPGSRSSRRCSGRSSNGGGRFAGSPKPCGSPSSPGSRSSRASSLACPSCVLHADVLGEMLDRHRMMAAFAAFQGACLVPQHGLVASTVDLRAASRRCRTAWASRSRCWDSWASSRRSGIASRPIGCCSPRCCPTSRTWAGRPSSIRATCCRSSRLWRCSRRPRWRALARPRLATAVVAIAVAYGLALSASQLASVLVGPAGGGRRLVGRSPGVVATGGPARRHPGMRKHPIPTSNSASRSRRRDIRSTW